MTGDVELVHNLIENHRDNLEDLTETGPVQGYAAQDEIEEAISHLDAALVDIEQAMEEE